LQRFGHSQCKECFENYPKKTTIRYSERDEQKREEFLAKIDALPEGTELHNCDESGFDEHYAREHGYAVRGVKVINEVSGKHFARTSIVAAKCGDDIIAPFAFKGTMNGDLFESWLEYVYAPSLINPTNVVLLIDNASSHRKYNIFDIAEEYGFRVIFLPPYSPNLNRPVENFWANVKRRLRLHMHEFETFLDALCYAFQ
jgi:putative transposase